MRGRWDEARRRGSKDSVRQAVPATLMENVVSYNWRMDILPLLKAPSSKTPALLIRTSTARILVLCFERCLASQSF